MVALTSLFSCDSGEVVDLDDYDPNVVASLLKLYLRELPEPLISPRITGRLEAAAGQHTHKSPVTQDVCFYV